MPFVDTIDDETTLVDLKARLESTPLALVVAVASFGGPKCKSLLDDLPLLEKDYDNGSTCCGPAPIKPQVLILHTDACDELEDMAIELGLNEIPSFQVYANGKLVASNMEGEAVSVASIRTSLQEIAATGTLRSSNGGGCCSPPTNNKTNKPAVCCPDDSSDPNSAPTDPSDVLRMVQQSYAATVNRNNDKDGGGGGCCVSVDPALMGYTPEQITKAGAESNLGLGCGNPMSFANLVENETVLDLGSGAGVDCFLAADLVGPSGTVIGVDMTPDMIYKARTNAVNKKTANVEFRLGEIEHLPVADGTVDCVVSNCVINLSPNKPQVFREIHRILKPGGRIAVSDVVIRPEKIIPDRLKTAEALAC